MTRLRTVALFVIAWASFLARNAHGEPAAHDLPPPVYDLSADIAGRTRQAREQLGPRTDVQIVASTFVVAAPGGRGAASSALELMQRALAAYFDGRFSTRPVRAISVYLFPRDAPYQAFCQKTEGEPCMSPYGFYSHGERRIVMNIGLGVGTPTHELVHPLVEADFPEAPDWLNEGIASLLEHFYLAGPAEIHGRKNWRHPRLVQALRSKSERSEATLPALFALSDAQFRGKHEDLNYASARFFCQWLDQQQLLWPFYQRFRDHYASDPSGADAFRAVVGKTPAEAYAAWRSWVLRL